MGSPKQLLEDDEINNVTIKKQTKNKLITKHTLTFF